MRFLPPTSSVALAVAISTSRNNHGADAFAPFTSTHRVVVHPSLSRLSSTTTNIAPETTEPESTQTTLPPPPTNSQQSELFENTGPLAWMQPYLEMFGAVPGQQIAYGPISSGEVDESKRTSPGQAATLRDEAARLMTNIDREERNRRLEASNGMAVATVLYTVWASLLGDQGDFAGHILRFGTILPLFFTAGYRLSAKTGVWNIAQSGLWSVDGNGLSEIEDPRLAQAFLDKVNAMNFDTALPCVVAAGTFAVLPQSASVPLVLVALTSGILYTMNGTLPKVE